MTPNPYHDLFVALGRIFGGWAAVLGTITLTQISVLVGIAVGVLAMVLTGLQIYVMWRDKIIRYRPSLRTRSTDHAPLTDQ